MHFEQGPIRPPSEAASLLIRVTRNCPWNKCAFCKTYKEEKFSRRPVPEIKQDIIKIKQLCRELQDLSRQWGEQGNITLPVIEQLQRKYDHTYLHLAVWLYYGGKTVFLQDANSLIVKTEELLQVLRMIKEYFPAVERITTYARSKTVCRKSPQELQLLHRAGLTRVHMGLESGSDTVLSLIKKGAKAADMIQAGQRLMQAGISLCYYVILGMGGKKYTQEHALETARVINSVGPDYVRFRTLSVLPGTPLADMVAGGGFQPLPEDDIIGEEKSLINYLKGINTNIVSDHANNLLEEVRGELPRDKDYMLKVMDRYLEMPAHERTNFRLGRRMGIYRFLSDMQDRAKYDYVSRKIEHLQNKGSLEETINHLRHRL